MDLLLKFFHEYMELLPWIWNLEENYASNYYFFNFVRHISIFEDTLGKKFSSLDSMLEQLTTKGWVDLKSIMREKFGDLQQLENQTSFHQYMLEFETQNQMCTDAAAEKWKRS